MTTAPRPPAAVTTSNPRVAAQSDAYELVGVLRGGRLRVYLDRFATNEPVTDAKIAVTVGGDEEVQAETAAGRHLHRRLAEVRRRGPAGAHLRRHRARRRRPPDRHPAASGEGRRGGSRARAAQSSLQALRNLPSFRVGNVEVPTPYLIAGVALALGFLLGLAVRGGGKLVPVDRAWPSSCSSSRPPTPSATRARPRREPPRPRSRPATRRAGCRTARCSCRSRASACSTCAPPSPKPEEAQKAISLIGRVIADPNRSGLVQSINGGRVIAPENGPAAPRPGGPEGRRPGPGRAGAARRPTAPPSPSGRARSSSRSRSPRRSSSASASSPSAASRPQSQIVDAETELEGLRRRREIVRQTRVEPEVLRAPDRRRHRQRRASSPARSCRRRTSLFQIVDPKGLWVEALVYGEVDPAKIAGRVRASAVDGTPLTLDLPGLQPRPPAAGDRRAVRGREPARRHQRRPARHGRRPERGRRRRASSCRATRSCAAATARRSSGATRTPSASRRRPVRTEPFDATRVVVRAGLAEGERIVTRGAELINQIR